MNEVLLQVENLSKSYQTKQAGKKRIVRAVDDVSFQLESGQSCAIIGASGSGKSTLVKMLFGLEKPDSGRIALSSSAGLVWQDPYVSLCPSMPIQEIIAEPLISRVRSRAERNEAVQKAISRVHLDPEIINRYPHQISGGQRQRVSIARAIITNPKVLVLDEPTSMLDEVVKGEVRNILEEMKAEIGILLVTHDIRFALSLCDQIHVMQSGKIIESCTVENIQAAQHPYTKRLILASTDLKAYWNEANTP